jgi:DNA integrity scanning protein DisA with diadenylate cyclase activity
MPLVLFAFKWHDLLDILVISFILHRLFLLFRGTIALQIILGLLLLWVIQGIAKAAGLVLTSWFFPLFSETKSVRYSFKPTLSGFYLAVLKKREE